MNNAYPHDMLTRLRVLPRMSPRLAAVFEERLGTDRPTVGQILTLNPWDIRYSPGVGDTKWGRLVRKLDSLGVDVMAWIEAHPPKSPTNIGSQKSNHA